MRYLNLINMMVYSAIFLTLIIVTLAKPYVDDSKGRIHTKVIRSENIPHWNFNTLSS